MGWYCTHPLKSFLETKTVLKTQKKEVKKASNLILQSNKLNTLKGVKKMKNNACWTSRKSNRKNLSKFSIRCICQIRKSQRHSNIMCEKKIREKFYRIFTLFSQQFIPLPIWILFFQYHFSFFPSPNPQNKQQFSL